MDFDPSYVVADLDQLTALYPPALERSLRKQIDHLDQHCRAFIAASPLVLMGTQAGESTDVSPRGDLPGFVEVANDRTLLLPDRRGNNRLDTLKNLIANPSIGLLFLVPGVNEAFRVNGTAIVSHDPQLCNRFAVNGQAPRTVIIVKVKEVYIHCSRALVRADLWNPAKMAIDRKVPTMGQVLEAHTSGFVEAEKFDEAMKTDVPRTLY